VLNFLIEFSINHDGRFVFVRYAHSVLGPVMPRRGSYFFLLAQEKANQKEGHPLYRPQKYAGGSLRCSPCRAAAELALRAQTVLADYPGMAALLGGTARGPKKQVNTSGTPTFCNFVVNYEKLNSYSLQPMPSGALLSFARGHNAASAY
jgi:hypothetical protein